MDPFRWSRVKEIFGEAVDLRPTQRDLFVREASAGCEEIEAEVVRLLRLHEEPDLPLIEEDQRGSLIRSAAQMRAFFPGEVLAGRYTVRRFIAEGGMGEVYEAEDMQLGERVALKTLRAEIADEDHVVWLRREIQAARRISHPNVCRMFDLVQTTTGDGRPAVFLTMELLEGETLSARLRREGAMTERQVLPIVRQMVAALNAAHQVGIIHRDFKTGNVMIVPRGNAAPRVVVTDFGLARPEARESRATQTMHSKHSSIAVGTPAYMAPEQIAGERVTASADIYALGVVLHELLTGELPFGDESPLKMAVRKTREQPPSVRTLSPTLRPNWNRALLRCLHPDPRKRFRQVGEVLEELEVRTARVAFWRRFLRQRRNHFQAAGIIAGLGIAAWAMWWLWPANPQADARNAWESGILALHMNEPVLAAGRFEEALEHYRLPPVVHAQLAQAWFEGGFESRAKQALSIAMRRPLVAESDRLFIRAVEAQIAGRIEIAKGLLAQRGNSQLADLAHLDELRWGDVRKQNPNYPPALLWSAMHFAKEGDRVQSESEFLAAETRLQAMADSALVRVVSARRGLSNIAAGQIEMARQDLPILERLPLRPKTGYGTCERVITLIAGVADNFAMPPDPVEFVSAESRAMQGSLARTVYKFDEWIEDGVLAASIPAPGLRYCSGEVETHVRRKPVAGSSDDKLMLRLMDSGLQNGNMALDLWSQDPWSTDRVVNRSIQIESFNQMIAKATGPTPFIDVWVQDDTSVDYIKVRLVY